MVSVYMQSTSQLLLFTLSLQISMSVLLTMAAVLTPVLTLMVTTCAHVDLVIDEPNPNQCVGKTALHTKHLCTPPLCLHISYSTLVLPCLVTHSSCLQLSHAHQPLWHHRMAPSHALVSRSLTRTAPLLVMLVSHLLVLSYDSANPTISGMEWM